MKAKSKTSRWGIARSVSAAGPIRISIRSATPARSKLRAAISAYSSESSQVMSRPPGARPRAIEIAE
jgi:hypothetical protein